jgi:hypothetical protein
VIAALALMLASVDQVHSASGVIKLGKPTSNVPSNAYFPLSGFHRIRQTATSGLRAELLVISDSALASGPERWPIVKALEQFGTLIALQPMDRPTFTLKAGTKTFPETAPSTLDWTHSQYRSRYLAFVHRDLQRYDSGQETFVPFQTLNASERVLYREYAQKGSGGQPSLPLIAVGNYLQTASQIINGGDFQGPAGPQNQPGPYLAFGTIQSALASAKDPPDNTLVEDVNAEANVITALICHADNLQPKKVCGRAVIKKLLKHVK